ncbi:HAD family hydrolase [bacterium]|nr:MAG: HAD family hydrolase [bacterium]
MQKLFLFDLDGTVLKVQNTIMAAIVDKSLTISGLEHEIKSEKKFAGRTDKDIFYSFVDAENHERYHQLKEAYIQLMLNELKPEHVSLISGVQEACHWLVDSNLTWGLLTGNYERSGLQKVRCSGFPLPVSFGVFGDEYAHRNHLAASSLAKAEAHFGHAFLPEELVIIGDTPKDIECAKVNGFISVAVSTGGYSKEELFACKPDFLIESLSELPALF